MAEWVKLVCAILSGVATAIPLLVKLVQYMQAAIKERNWKQVIDLVTRLMTEAEGKFDNGAERKEWVLMMVKATADTIEYDINLNVIGDLIDSLCAMSNVVNNPVAEATEAAEE